ncbi:HAD-IC family P-type ATPase [Xanthomonadaceae bacterium XH05]|nr:HAD-IC family P-type ATPase [Xanthomonadaceae bacterium XH05]
MQTSPPESPDTTAVPWHAMSADAVCGQLGSGIAGLSAREAARRLQQHGPNLLPEATTRPSWKRLLAQFNNALILFLLAAAVIAGMLGHVVDAGVIVAVVLINATVGFVQEGRAEHALSALRAMLAPSARVIRAERRMALPVAELVPGDVVLLEAGDRVPADLRLLRARGLLIDEAVLTGESVTAQKHEGEAAADAALGDRHGMAWSGTLVAAGQATGIVVETGARTQIGRISVLLGEIETLTTPLLRKINRFGRQFTFVSIAVAALLLVFAVFARDYGWLDGFMVVVALAVGVVPESLPAVITITLAIGVRRMAARHAIVRRLPAVETLGATTVICSDKTGTLTRNEMTARRVVSTGGAILVEGAGYTPEGKLQLPAGQAQPCAAAEWLLQCGLLCNDAHLLQRDGHWQVDGDPMEGALIAVAAKAGFRHEAVQASWPRLDGIPFDAAYRYMATLHRAPDGGAIVFVKGAPEQVLALCSRQLAADGEVAPLDVRHWDAAIDAAGVAGERVLGFALKRLGAAPERLDFDDVSELAFLGIIGFIDPPRPEAIAAVADCRSAGIGVKMITGDHAATAVAIARQLGIAEQPQVVTGRDLDSVTDADLPALAQRATVFARTSPEHKLRVVQALQSQGHVVAMTGDGVNDAPSLKRADVGIAMGNKGTEAAKEASQIVLTDDNFASIVAAVNEGRTVYDNIRKVVAWTLPTNGGEALAIIAAIALGLTLPMTPAQILWINMVLTVTLGLVLAFEPAEPGAMQRPPRHPQAPLISPFMLWRIMLVSLLFTAGAFGIYAWAMFEGYDVALARTMVVNTICVLEIFYLFNVRYLHMRSFTLRGIRGTPAVLWAISVVVLAQLVFTYLPLMQRLFDTRPVPLHDGLVIVAIGIALFVALEIEKWLLRRLGWFDELGTAATTIRTQRNPA